MARLVLVYRKSNDYCFSQSIFTKLDRFCHWIYSTLDTHLSALSKIHRLVLVLLVFARHVRETPVTARLLIFDLNYQRALHVQLLKRLFRWLYTQYCSVAFLHLPLPSFLAALLCFSVSASRQIEWGCSYRFANKQIVTSPCLLGGITATWPGTVTPMNDVCSTYVIHCTDCKFVCFDLITGDNLYLVPS